MPRAVPRRIRDRRSVAPAFRRVAILLAAGLGLTGAPAWAQPATPWHLDLRAGAAVPTGDLTDVTDPGPHVGLGFGYRIFERLGISVDLGLEALQGTTLSDPVGGEEGRVETPDLRIWHFDAGGEVALLDPGGPWDLGLLVAGGIARFDSDLVEPGFVGGPQSGGRPIDLSETYPSLRGGVRLGRRVGPSLDLFVGASAYVRFADEEDTAVLTDLDEGIEPFGTVLSLPLSAGVRLRF